MPPESITVYELMLTPIIHFFQPPAFVAITFSIPACACSYSDYNAQTQLQKRSHALLIIPCACTFMYKKILSNNQEFHGCIFQGYFIGFKV